MMEADEDSDEDFGSTIDHLSRAQLSAVAHFQVCFGDHVLNSMEEVVHADDQTPEILDVSSTELEKTASLNSSVSEIEISGDESSTELENTSSINSSVSEIETSGIESSTELENTSPNSSMSEIEATGDESTVETNHLLVKGPPTEKPS